MNLSHPMPPGTALRGRLESSDAATLAATDEFALRLGALVGRVCPCVGHQLLLAQCVHWPRARRYAFTP